MNSRFKVILGFLVLGFSCFWLLVGCGGDSSTGGGGGSNSSTGGLSAYVVDGPVSNANCNLYDPFAATISPITSSASVNGHVTFTGIPLSYQNYLLLIQCSGGSYFDEATGMTINLPTTKVQQAMFKYNGNSTTNVTVSPLTTIAASVSPRNGGILEDYPLHLRQVAILFGLGDVDISSVQPTDVNLDNADPSIAGQYGIVLAMLSEMMKDKPTTYPDLTTLTSTIANNYVGGTFGDTIKADMEAALINYSNNPLNRFVSKSLIATNSPLFINLSNGNGGGKLTSQTNFDSITIYANTTKAGISYGLPITAKGGTPPYHYRFDTFLNGSPPLGLSVNLVTGELNGIPTVPGNYHFGVCAVDLVGAESCSQVQMTVVAPTTPPPPPSNGDYYYHWNCNGDSECLGTNPRGTPTGNINMGSGAGGQSSCNSLLTFASHFWGSAAVNSCNQSPN